MSIKAQFRGWKMMQRAAKAPYPIHGRTLGFLGTAREPYTWFVCNNGHREMGKPWAEPERECFLCQLDKRTEGFPPFRGWEVAGSAAARSATMDAIGDSTLKAELFRRTQT